jgi:hypothetical protein
LALRLTNAGDQAMTHNILLADIDYARRQLKLNAAEAAIVAGLVTRGIEPAKAAQLVDDLRNGRKITPDVQLAFRSRRRRSAPAAEGADKPDRSPQPAAGEPEPAPKLVSAKDPVGSLKTRLMIAGLLVAVLGLGGLALYHYRFSPEAQQERDEVPPVSTNAAPAASQPQNPSHK